MNCISPPGLEDWQLLAYLDSEADSETELHLQECSYCRERAKVLSREQNVLTFRLHRLTCPSAAELGEFHLRMLPPSQMLIISQHLRECPSCTREVLQLREFLGDLVLPREGNLFGQAKVLIAQIIDRQRETYSAGEMPFALRGEGKSPVTFEVGGVLIVVDVQPTTDGDLTVLGQVAAENQDDWTDALVRFHQDHLQEIASRVDDLGAFRCEGILPGTLALEIIARNGTVIEVPAFEVSS